MLVFDSTKNLMQFVSNCVILQSTSRNLCCQLITHQQCKYILWQFGNNLISEV